MEIPDNLEKYLPYFDAVLLENHGALTWSTDLNAAYMKMESLVFYAELLYKSKMLGGPKEFDEANIKKLYQIRQKFGMPGKHPANVCLNKGGTNCHNCGGNCGEIDRTMPGYQYDFSDSGSSRSGGGVTEEQVAAIVKNVLANMK
jgi:L-fuculose-phosphate aldolase